MFKFEKKKVIVVYKEKDEIALNYLRKLIETDDDKDGEIIGTEDDSVSVIAWTEKVYRDNKTQGNISNKIIFLDDVEGANSIKPIMDTKYSSNGVCYGFAGNQAVISIDEGILKSDDEFMKFQKEFEELMNKINEKAQKIDKSKELDNHKNAKTGKILAVVLAIAYPFIGIPFAVGAAIADSTDRKNLREKMFLFAITKFYIEEMDSFMKS